jgi:predicted Zn-dependent protease
MKEIFMLFFSLTSCAAPTPEETAQEIKDELRTEIADEINIGREMAAKLLGHVGAYESDPKATEYVNLVGGALAQKVGRSELVYRFALLSSDEINAFATPGGYVFITKGLLAAVNDESELAAVLAHEIAHINEKHMYLEIAPKRKVSATETVARVMSRGHSDMGKSITQLVNKGLKMLLEEGMGLEKERQADDAGIYYAEAAGYNPHAMVRFLKRISAETGPKIPKTAPPFNERIAAVEKLLKENSIEDRMLAKAETLKERFNKYLAKYHSVPQQKM